MGCTDGMMLTTTSGGARSRRVLGLLVGLGLLGVMLVACSGDSQGGGGGTGGVGPGGGGGAAAGLFPVHCSHNHFTKLKMTAITMMVT